MTVVALSVGRFPVFCSPSPVLSGNTACASNSLNPKVFPYESTIPPICGIYLPFQVNLYVPNSKPSNEILFCMDEQLMLQLGLPISSMLGGLFLRGVDSAPHSWERAGNRDAKSHDPKRSKQIKIIKQNSPRVVFSWRHSLFRASHGLMLVGGCVSINFYHFALELPIMHVLW